MEFVVKNRLAKALPKNGCDLSDKVPLFPRKGERDSETFGAHIRDRTWVVFGWCRCRNGLPQRATYFDDLRIILLAVRRLPVDVKELAKGAFDGCVVEAQRNKASLLVQRVAKAERAGLQLRPLRAERMCRHAEHQHTGAFQPFLDLRRDAVAGFDLPFIEPDLDAVLFQMLGQWADDLLVLGTVAQEDVVLEFVRHDRVFVTLECLALDARLCAVGVRMQ